MATGGQEDDLDRIQTIPEDLEQSEGDGRREDPNLELREGEGDPEIEEERELLREERRAERQEMEWDPREGVRLQGRIGAPILDVPLGYEQQDAIMRAAQMQRGLEPIGLAGGFLRGTPTMAGAPRLQLPGTPVRQLIRPATHFAGPPLMEQIPPPERNPHRPPVLFRTLRRLRERGCCSLEGSKRELPVDL